MEEAPETNRNADEPGASSLWKRLSQQLRFYRRPPVKTWRFWEIQIIVGCIFAIQELTDHLVGTRQTSVPLFVIVTAYAVPVLYAAINFGLYGTVLTAALTTACVGIVMGQHLAAHDSLDAWADNAQVVILDVVAAIVGHFVEVTDEARLEATNYATRVVRSQEDERRRIARELHDDPIQILVHLCRTLDRLPLVDPADLEARGAVREARNLAESVTAGLRDIARGLRPAQLEDLGLIPALDRLCQDLEARSEIKVSFALSGDERELGEDVELALFRITQEALSNVEKHADAHNAWVEVVFRDSEAVLTVADDGKGFERPDKAAGTMGILSMVDRARSIGAELLFAPRKPRGTQLLVRLAYSTSTCNHP